MQRINRFGERSGLRSAIVKEAHEEDSVSRLFSAVQELLEPITRKLEGLERNVANMKIQQQQAPLAMPTPTTQMPIRTMPEPRQDSLGIVD